MKILIAKNEQLPYSFARYGIETERATIRTGDYSCVCDGIDYRDRVAVERKELNDLLGCLTIGRARFERELTRGSAMELFQVAIEASFDDIRYHRYKSDMTPKSAIASILAFQARYRIPFCFYGSRQGSEYGTVNTLRLWLKDLRAAGV